jgi:nitrogen fixation protein FixH
MKKGLGWPLGVAVILACTIAANIYLVVVANGDESFAIEKDYYQKALRWDDEMEQQRRNAALGWWVEPRLELGPGTSGGRLQVMVRDASGRAVADARVGVTAFHNARANTHVTATLREDSAGIYSAPLTADRQGIWELRVVVEQGDVRFTARQKIEASPRPLN